MLNSRKLDTFIHHTNFKIEVKPSKTSKTIQSCQQEGDGDKQQNSICQTDISSVHVIELQ